MFAIKFWGVRGSIACPSPRHMKYGGNTSCVEVIAGENRFILDAGTGIRLLGKEFLLEDVRTISLLLTHTHWDHINGLPFFRPAYDPKRRMHIFAGHLNAQSGIEKVLSQQMNEPVFPVPLEAMRAIVEFEDFVAGESFALNGSVKVRTARLNHPNGATGYRIEYDGCAACYITDTEHTPGRPDENILALIAGADLVIYDSTYTDEEFPSHTGWGHSTWQEGVRLCRQSGAKNLAIFHHEPDHEDDFMDAIALEAKATWDRTFVAREGMVVDLTTI
jgi:Metal-dependent hydrolases of the beta-lactamase superfamily I